MLLRKIAKIAIKYPCGFSKFRFSQTTSTETINDVVTTNKLNIVNTLEQDVFPTFQVMNEQGEILDGSPELGVDSTLCKNMYSTMLRIQILDDIMYNAQRQGRISFYMQASGEEAIHIGTASVLTLEDIIFAQYREQGVLLWRGFTIQQAVDQCYSNISDLGKGRQMPIHYGSRELNYQTVSSPLTTQLPQAVGAGFSLKLQGKDAVAMCYFGEGAASEGDFHAALNFASTLDVPIIFFCRNNGYAISTPSRDQYRGDGIVSRAAGYGMHCIRVDGNDLFAVRLATEEARRLAIEKSCPVLIEAMTYRGGHHSTSDDSTRYRTMAEIKHYQELGHPIQRFRKFMESRGWWSEEEELALRDKERMGVLAAIEVAEKKEKPPLSELFTDVYKEKPWHLQKQEQELNEHMMKYPEYYGGKEDQGH